MKKRIQPSVKSKPGKELTNTSETKSKLNRNAIYKSNAYTNSNDWYFISKHIKNYFCKILFKKSLETHLTHSRKHILTYWYKRNWLLRDKAKFFWLKIFQATTRKSKSGIKNIYNKKIYRIFSHDTYVGWCDVKEGRGVRSDCL